MDRSHKGFAGPERTPERIPEPAVVNELNGLDFKGKYHSDRIAGDFFDAVLSGNRMTVLLTDIAGTRAQTHAIAADMQDTFRKRAKERLGAPEANESEGIARLLHDLNGTLMSASGGVRCAPTFLGCYNASLAILTYINAGGPPPIFRDSDGTRALEAGGVPLGLFSHMTHEPYIQAFEPGARMLVVTKGVIDNQEFGLAELTRLFQKMDARSAPEICETVLETAHGFWKRHRFLRTNKSENGEDLTVVALVRGGATAIA